MAGGSMHGGAEYALILQVPEDAIVAEADPADREPAPIQLMCGA